MEQHLFDQQLNWFILDTIVSEMYLYVEKVG